MKVDLGIGAMAGLAREAQSYRHLSAVPTLPGAQESSCKSKPIKKTRSRPTAVPANGFEEEQNSAPVVTPTSPILDQSKSPPPIAPRPKSRGAKPPSLPPKASSTSSESDVVSPKVRLIKLSLCVLLCLEQTNVNVSAAISMKMLLMVACL